MEAQQRLIHRAKLFHFPADGRLEIRCIDCDETLIENPLDPEVTFYLPGECTPRLKNQIDTGDGIGVQDTIR